MEQSILLLASSCPAYGISAHLSSTYFSSRKGWFSNTSFTTGLKTLPTFRPDALVFFRAKRIPVVKLVIKNQPFLMPEPAEKPSLHTFPPHYCTTVYASQLTDSHMHTQAHTCTCMHAHTHTHTHTHTQGTNTPQTAVHFQCM